MAGPVVTVRLFAHAREAVGRSSVRRPVPAEGIELRALLAALASEYPGLRRVLAGCRFAVNDEYVPGDMARLSPGDELAVHPPYSGG